MARTKQLPHNDITTAANTIDISEDSDTNGNIAVDAAPSKATQPSKTKKNATVTDPSKKSAVNQNMKTASGPVKNSKGKGKATADVGHDEGMDIDMENLTGKKWPDHALVGPPSRDINVLKRDNEMLEEENRRLQQTLDKVLEAVKPGIREEEMQAEINALNELIKRQKSLLELRNSEYTKSRLINHDPAEPADWVTLDWAENARDNAVAELTKQMEKLTTRAEKAEKAKKDAERECTEAKRLLVTLQREYDAEVVHSKQLQAEINRRPATIGLGSTSGFGTGGTTQGKHKTGQSAPGAYEMEKKLELFEGLTGIGIVSYVETIRQPGDVKAVTYTCLLSIDGKELPFKLTVWDTTGATEGEDDETEHVVYTPSEPLDPELELDYLKSSFTFPRSQMRVFYQNMMNMLTLPAEEEGEEEE